MKPALAIAVEYPIGMSGGVSVLACSLIIGLADDYRLFLVSTDPDSSTLPPAISRRLEGHFFWNPKGRVGSITFRKHVLDLGNWLEQHHVSLIHLHCGGIYGWGNRYPFCSIARHSARKGIKVFWTNHLVVSPVSGACGPKKPAWFKALVLPFAWLGKVNQMQHSVREICVSNHDLAKVARWFPPHRKKLLRIYHSRISDKWLGPARFPISERPKVITNIGHIAFRKGQHILVESFCKAASTRPDWQLQLGGHDSGDGCWQRIQTLIADYKMHSRVSLLGDVSHVADLLAATSIYVQPSLHEALGLALQEAIAAGCPAIGSATGGIPELIKEGFNGLLVEPGSVSELVTSLGRLMDADDLRSKFSANAANLLEKLEMTESAMINAHRSLYSTAPAE